MIYYRQNETLFALQGHACEVVSAAVSITLFRDMKADRSFFEAEATSWSLCGNRTSLGEDLKHLNYKSLEGKKAPPCYNSLTLKFLIIHQV